MSKHSRLVSIHSGMKHRCYNAKCKGYKNYGGREILVCSEWLDSERVNIGGHNNPSKGFLAFKQWALANGYKDNLSLDRIDNNKGYSPENCRWVTAKTQNNNRRNNISITYRGVTKTLHQWSEELHISYTKLFQRLNKLHWSVERAFESD